MTAAALVLALAATLGLVLLALGAGRLAEMVADLRLWVLAHDDELADLAADRDRERVLAGLRRRGEPVERLEA